jgi:hypothetical protein
MTEEKEAGFVEIDDQGNPVMLSLEEKLRRAEHALHVSNEAREWEKESQKRRLWGAVGETLFGTALICSLLGYFIGLHFGQADAKDEQARIFNEARLPTRCLKLIDAAIDRLNDETPDFGDEP